tara:strand:- start:505 stop:837 length:333 start_codon:yes stop_codon:yes gene_type:complete
MELQNKTAFITGGASGLGLATARNFIAAGAKVILFDLNEDMLLKAAAELGDNAIFHAGDVADEVSVAAALEKPKKNLARYTSMLTPQESVELRARLERTVRWRCRNSSTS